MYIKVNTQSGPVAVAVKRKGIKSIRLRVTSDSEVEVSAPYYVKESVIHSFIQDNAGFIEKKLFMMDFKRACSYPLDYKDGDVFTLMGQRVVLCVAQAGRAAAKLEGGVLALTVTDARNRESRRRAFVSWLKKYAKQTFDARLGALQPQFENLGGKRVRISVRDMKTRWGSINVKKDTMSLSVHLMRCESELIDHIIIHELCHYSHANHSNAFYEELKKHSPDYKKLQKRLKDYGMVGF